jgi:hypothetical protein
MDKMSVVSPTLPLSRELRELTKWLKAHAAAGDFLIVDDFNYEGADILRFSGIPASQAFAFPAGADRALMESQLHDFVNDKRPHFLVYSPRGRLGRIWALGSDREIEPAGYNLLLRQRWQWANYRVYEIIYR